MYANDARTISGGERVEGAKYNNEDNKDNIE